MTGMSDLRKSCGIWETGSLWRKKRWNSKHCSASGKERPWKRSSVRIAACCHSICGTGLCRQVYAQRVLEELSSMGTFKPQREPWLNLKKENDSAWKCLGDGFGWLMKRKATVYSMRPRREHRDEVRGEGIIFKINRNAAKFALSLIWNWFCKDDNYWTEKACSVRRAGRPRLLILPGSSLPFACGVDMTRFGILSCISRFFWPARNTFRIELRKTGTTSSQAVHIRLWIWPLTSPAVWAYLNARSQLGFITSRNMYIHPRMSCHKKRMFYKVQPKRPIVAEPDACQQASFYLARASRFTDWAALKRGGWFWQHGDSPACQEEERPKGQLPCKKKAAWLTLWKETEL